MKMKNSKVVMRTQHTQSSSDLVLPTVHQPVLLQSVLDALAVQPTDVVLDATLGGAGHAQALALHLGEKGFFIGIDADSAALVRAEETLSAIKAKKIFVQTNFRTIAQVVADAPVEKVDKILFDLGFSSDQIELTGRGFSFMRDEPLLMTLSDDMSKDTLTAHTIVNTWGEESIADILFGWGEERFSRRIAKAIVTARKEKEISTTFELVDIIRSAVPASYRNGKIHPATRTFQALRIAVNDEIGALNDALHGARTALAPNGRVAVITFHSIEDRIVKNTFKDWQKEGLGTVLTKKPIAPTNEEVKENRRARSAKLRVFEKGEKI
jgi:16S rRNA (cytosine1402-N4)-methyltransferase